MEMMRNWILQIAGIIVLGSVCDAVMPKGEMKKYVKLVVGLVLTFAVIKPLMNVTVVDFELPVISQGKAAEYKESLQAEEQKSVLNIYRKKLAEKVEKFVLTQWNIRAKAHVEVEESDRENFGNVLSVEIELQEKANINTDPIRKGLSENFGVKKENIRIVLR